MKIEKNELARKIGQLKNIVPSRTTIEALKGVLYKDGYLIASDTELTVKAKLEGIDIESEATIPFIIPSKSFELIRSLPAGEIELSAAEDTVTIKQGKIKNKFKTLSADQFSYNRESIEGELIAYIPAEDLKSAIAHTIYAVATSGANVMMLGMNLKCKDGKLNFVGLDGHRIAWDCIPCDGDFDVIVPRSALDNILKLDLQGDIKISKDNNGALFKSEDYEVYTRLIAGDYFKYENMFAAGDIGTIIDRREFSDAINRARLCGSDEDKAPVILELDGSVVHITYKNQTSDYREDVQTVSECTGSLKIGFAPRLLIDSLKAFECDNVTMDFNNAKTPVIIKAEDSDMTALVLPVNIKG